MGGDESVELRPAATVIVALPGTPGVEILMLRRSGKSRFLPGYLVFPGGAVDEGDSELAERWFGDRAESSRACAIRELIEEVGLAVTLDGLRVARGRELGTVSASPPAADQLPQISHWIAPEEVPVRFDARFYAVAAPAGLEPSPDGAEAEGAWFARPSDLLDDYAAGRCSLYWPTMKTLKGLARCDSVRSVLALDLPAIEDDEPDDPQPSGAPAPEVGQGR